MRTTLNSVWQEDDGEIRMFVYNDDCEDPSSHSFAVEVSRYVGDGNSLEQWEASFTGSRPTKEAAIEAARRRGAELKASLVHAPSRRK